MSSLLRPNKHMLSHFPKFGEWGHVVKEIPVSTRRLDDIAEISAMDFLKIDAQGSETTNPYAAIHQLLEADIVYVRDFTRPDSMSNE